MELSDLPEQFQSHVRITTDYGCWRWIGSSTPTGYPAYKRQAAWMWAYRHVHGELPKGDYPIIEACHGPVICANPDHRLSLPIDLVGQPHRCSVCKKWHDPDEEYRPVVASQLVRPQQGHAIVRPPIRKISLRDILAEADNSDLTPEQRELEDMMDDSNIGRGPASPEEA
jgi:hypothetical protein